MFQSRFIRSFHFTRALFKRIPYLLADIGEGITEHVKPGEAVEQFQKLCEVQSDKAAVEITSRYDGIVTKLFHNVGDMAKVGQPLVEINLEDTQDSPVEEPKLPSADTPQQIILDKLPIVTSVATSHEILTTPAVRRVARELSVDLRNVKGSGKDNRILKSDVISFKDQRTPQAETNQPQPVVQSQSSPHSQTDDLKPLTPLQKAMFRQMTKSSIIPHFGYSDEVILDSTAAYRATINNYLSKGGKEKYHVQKISYMPIFLKSLSMALLQFPVLNCKVVDGMDEKSARLQYRKQHNIGIAMDTPNGLIVPNVKDCQIKSILEIAAEIERLKIDGKNNAIKPADLVGGTITLSNIGTIGGTYLHPVLVSSEVCIGALGESRRIPRFNVVTENGVEKEIVVAKTIMPVSWNADHRVIDGATVARFVQLWKTYLENPALISAVSK